MKVRNGMGLIEGLDLQWNAADQFTLLETLRNITAGRLRTAEWRKTVAQDRECTVSREVFSSFCRSEAFSRFVA